MERLTNCGKSRTMNRVCLRANLISPLKLKLSQTNTLAPAFLAACQAEGWASPPHTPSPLHVQGQPDPAPQQQFPSRSWDLRVVLAFETSLALWRGISDDGPLPTLSRAAPC